nr:uncharacterized protein LOC109153589 [Ipomoea batatas]
MVVGGVVTRNKRRGPQAQGVGRVVVVLGFLVLVSRFSAAASREWECCYGWGLVGWVCALSISMFCAFCMDMFFPTWLHGCISMCYLCVRSEHYFLVCFDFRRFWMEVIDNNPSPVATKNKYGESLIDMVLLLCPRPPQVAHVLDFFLLFSIAFSLLLFSRFPLPLLLANFGGFMRISPVILEPTMASMADSLEMYKRI